jgi:hypothetical protein
MHRWERKLRRGAAAWWTALMLVPVAISPAPGQELICSLEVSLNAGAACELSLGYRHGASSGLDDLDLPAPPPTPDAALDAAFNIPGIAAPLPRRWLADYRPPDAGFIRNDTWELALVSAPPGGACRLAVVQTGVTAGDHLLSVSGVGPADRHIPVPGELTFNLPGPVLRLRLRFLGPRSLQEIGSWGRIKALFRG